MQQLPPGNRDQFQICKDRQAAGMPANQLHILSADRICLSTPKGSQWLRWDGNLLVTATGKPLNLNQIIIDQVVEALAAVHGPVYETKRGAEIQDGDREGWGCITDVEDAGDGAALVYQRLVTPADYRVIWFSASDVVR